jgi:hypothetical protein
MKAFRVVLPVLGVALWTSAAHAAATIDVQFPAANAGLARGRIVAARVHVASEFALKAVTVRVGAGAMATADCSSSDATGRICYAQVPTTGLANGPATLSVDVTDVFDDVSTGTQPVVVDDAPSILGTAPGSLVTSPTLSLTCADTGLFGCASLRLGRVEANRSETTLATGTASVAFPTTTLDGIGPAYKLFAVATDTKGIETRVELGLTVDLTPGIPVLSRVDGAILQVSEKYILFAPRSGGVSVRDRRTGTDTLVSAVATTGYLVDEGAIASGGSDGTTVLWAGALRPNVALGSTGRGSYLKGLSTDGRRVVYAGTDIPSGDAYKCYVMDLATGASTEVADFAALYPGNASLCRPLGIARNGDVYVYGNTGGNARPILRIAGGVAADTGAPSFTKGVVLLDDTGHVAFDISPTNFRGDLYYDTTKFGTGSLLELRDGFTLATDGRITVRQPDGTVVDRTVLTAGVAQRLGDGGEVSVTTFVGDVATDYLMPLVGKPVQVARGPGSFAAIGAGWLLAQGDTLRCVRAPCGFSNVVPVDPDAGAPDGSVADAAAEDAAPVPSAPAADGGVVASPSPAGESGCATAPGSGLPWFGLFVVGAVVAGRRWRMRSRKRTFLGE